MRCDAVLILKILIEAWRSSGIRNDSITSSRHRRFALSICTAAHACAPSAGRQAVCGAGYYCCGATTFQINVIAGRACHLRAESIIIYDDERGLIYKISRIIKQPPLNNWYPILLLLLLLLLALSERGAF
jgi:hypothetical protein